MSSDARSIGELIAELAWRTRSDLGPVDVSTARAVALATRPSGDLGWANKCSMTTMDTAGSTS
jgi:hypothetical protein